MSSRSFRLGSVIAGLVVSSLLVASNASAAYHAMKIVEVMGGPGSYVNLEMYSGGQTVLGGHTIDVYDTTDNLLFSVPLAAVPKGDGPDPAAMKDGSRILIGTDKTEATFGVKPDFATLKTLPLTGGKVCFDPAASAIDCFSWGNYPNKVPTGAPFAALDEKSAAKRKVAGGPTAKLDDADDTNSCSADFAAGTPSPKNNEGKAGAPAGVDAGSTTSSSSSASSTGGNPSSASSSSTSGATTNPSSSTTTSSSGAPAAAPAPAEDEGCNTAGDTGGLTAIPLLALVGLAVLKRRSQRRGSAPAPRSRD